MNYFIQVLVIIFLVSSCKTTGDQLKGQFWDNTPAYLGEKKDFNNEQGRAVAEEMKRVVDKDFDGDYVAGVVRDGPQVKPASCKTRDPVVRTTGFSSLPKGKGKDPKYAYSLKNYPRPCKGCYPVENISLEEADELMASQNLTIQSGDEGGIVSPTEKRTLGAALKWIQYLNGGPLIEGIWEGDDLYPFIIRSGVKSSAQRGDHIQIKKSYSQSVAQYVHEYGHFIGNRGGYAAYGSYMKGFGNCRVSNYALRNDNEQFCEAFTAFVTEPNILLNNTDTSDACKRAFQFFKGWFKKGERVEQCM